MHSQKEPAAKTTRVGGPSKGSLPERDQINTPLNLEDQLPFIGDVRERKTGSEHGLVKGVEGSFPVESGFPHASHRSKSKFMFGRKETRRVDQNIVENYGGVDERNDSIGQEAAAILNSMNIGEIESARKELLARLPAKTVSFLKKRGSRNNEKSASNTDASTGTGGAGHGEMQAIAHDVETSQRHSSNQKLSILQRLKFNISGEIADILPESMNDDMLHATTLQRDIVRQNEGSVDSSGCYSLLEAKILARSTDVNQRAIGLRYVSNILGSCKNHIWRGDGPIDLNSLSLQEIPSVKGPITWLNIWQHALYSVRITKVIRYAMDDSKGKVLREACNALVSLVGLPDVGIKLLKDADMNPSIGFPKCQICHMQRSDTNQWVTMPLDILHKKEIYRADDPMETDEQDLARIDPISGMVNMNILSRVSYLLNINDGTVDSKSKKDLVLVLIAFASAGSHVGNKMVQTPNLLHTLISFLPAYTESRKMNELTLLTIETCCILIDYVENWRDEKTVQKLANFAMNALLSWNKEEGTCESLEAIMKLWRSLKLAGKLFTSFDDMYPSLCFYMFPGIIDPQKSGSLLLIGGREAFLIAAACALAGHISPSCISSILNDIFKWSDEMASLVTSTQGFYDFESDMLSMVAAILQFLQCLLQTKTVWENDENQEAGGKVIKDIIERLSKMLMIDNDDPIPHGFWEAGTQCTCRMAIISAFLNLVYLSGSNILHGSNMIEKLLNSISHIDLMSMADFDILQPWDMKLQQYVLQLARLVDSTEMNAEISGENEAEIVQITQLNIKLMSLLPPGSEQVGLRLLSHMFGDPAKHFIRRGILEMHLKASEVSYIGSLSQNSLESADALRVKALHASSSILGYELKDASDWKHLKRVQSHYGHHKAILIGDESVLPLKNTWIFATAGNAGDVDTTLTSYQGIMSWILGMEASSVLYFLSPAVKHFSLIKSLFDHTDKQEETAILHDPMIRLLGSTLLQFYMKAIKSAGEFQPAWTLQEVRHITENFITDSYGDLFFGISLSSLFCDQIVSPDWQEEILALLKDGMALQYLPKSNKCPYDATMGLIGTMPESEEKTMKFQFLVDVIASESFATALEAESLSVDIIMQHIMRAIQKNPSTSSEAIKIVLKRLERYRNIKGIGRAMKYLQDSLLC